MSEPQTYRYTYGRDVEYPFIGGWTEIEAPSRELADALFMALHPARKGSNLLNCANVYNEKEWQQTIMCRDNENFGFSCHERYKITQES